MPCLEAAIALVEVLSLPRVVRQSSISPKASALASVVAVAAFTTVVSQVVDLVLEVPDLMILSLVDGMLVGTYPTEPALGRVTR